MVATRSREAAVILGIIWDSLYLYDEVELPADAALSSMFALVLIHQQEDVRGTKSITECLQHTGK